MEKRAEETRLQEVKKENWKAVVEQQRVDSRPGLTLNTHPVVGEEVPLGESLRMSVVKRDGRHEVVDPNKIIQAVTCFCDDLDAIDPMRVAGKAISGLHDGASTVELDRLCVRTASLLIGEEPQYSKLAARLLTRFVEKEVSTQDIRTFSESIAFGASAGLISADVARFVRLHADRLDATIERNRSENFEYFGLRTIYDRYLLKNPESRLVIETPQYFFMRVAAGLSQTPEETIEFYRLISSLGYMPSSPTLFNSGTEHTQLSSCYLLDSPTDDLEGIYSKYADVARLSKYAGGIGIAYHRVRSRGSLIRGTNGHSNGVVPWLKTLDSSVSAVNQGGKRKGAACVYLETWHADIEEFLELRDNTGDEARRTHNLNLANWIPDLFMKRVEQGAAWSLFDPKVVPHFPDIYGEEFERAYVEAEMKGLFEKQISARELYSRMMKSLAQTGNGWMTFKDSSNRKCNQVGPGNTVHLSNLCTEIIEVTSSKETAVCNLGSVNLGLHVRNGRFDFEMLSRTVKTAIKYLDRVIDINFYPINQAGDSNRRWRPVGFGQMGLQDALFQLGLPFDSLKGRELSKKIAEEIYFSAVSASCDLAEKFGAHDAFPETRASKGLFQFELWGVKPTNPQRWEALRTRMLEHGLRNSLMIAIAPTATIASICGCYEAIEPQVSNFFKRETLSGEFIQINRYLISDLKKLGLWTEEVREKLKFAEGSIQDIEEIPDYVKEIYRTAWEIPQRSLVDMAADRGAFIDQSQSLNLFMESPTIGKLSSMYMYAWQKGLKTTYYLRSRPATRINKTVAQKKIDVSGAQAVSCSLENPESCESCQ